MLNEYIFINSQCLKELSLYKKTKILYVEKKFSKLKKIFQVKEVKKPPTLKLFTSLKSSELIPFVSARSNEYGRGTATSE